MNYEDLDSKQLNDLMRKMPEDARHIFQQLLTKASCGRPLRIIKNFIENFDDTNAIDGLISMIAGKAINEMGIAISRDMELSQKEGNEGYPGSRAALISIRILREIAEGLETSMQENGLPITH